MTFTAVDFLNEKECVKELETLFQIAVQQGENLIIQCPYFTYLIRKDEGAIRRMRKWKQIYEETQTS